MTANFFGIPLGIAGLTQCWAVANTAGVVPRWPVTTLWVLTSVVWVVVAVAFLVSVVPEHRLAGQPADPTFGPFTSAALLVPTMVSVALTDHAPTAGRVLFTVFVVLSTGYGGWMTGQWIISDLRLAQIHPGYFIPTVATGYVAAAATAKMGHDELARVLFGYGTLCWMALGSIVWARVFLAGPLPAALVPTLAIEVAPPVVAGGAWFAIHGLRSDDLSLFLAGYAVLMVLVQLRLIPVYARLPFAAGWWAFAFSYAAACALALQWVVVTDVGHRSLWMGALLLVISAGVGLLAVRTLLGLVAGTFVARFPVTPAPAGPGGVV